MDSESEDRHATIGVEQHLDRAFHSREEGKLRKALKECEAAAKAARSLLADAYNLRGIILEELARYEEAMEAYGEALDIQPGFREAADNLCELETERGVRHQLVTIATFSHASEAHVLKTKLQSEGIWAFVADEHTVTMNWLYSNAIGGVKLQVRESDVERSLEILGLEPSGTELGESEEDEKDDEWRCPNCDSLNVRFERYSKWGIFLPWLLLNFPLPFLKRKWKCAECGHEWKGKDWD